MPLHDRIALYEQIEAHRGRPLIVYVTTKRPGVESSMASDVLPYLMDQIGKIDKKETKVDILIASLGGDPMVAWRIMSLVGSRFDEVDVLVPQSAYSAATLLALGAKKIIMHPNGNLGPVDMQIAMSGDSGPKQFSTEDILAFFEYVRDELKISDQEHLRVLFQDVCKEIGPLGVGVSARSSRLAVALGEKLLALHHPDKEEPAKLRAIIESLSREFHTHAYPVSRKEAISIGLQVNTEEERDEKLEGLMWNVWLDIEEELQERVQAFAMADLLASSEASKLLAPVPMISLPPNIPTTNYLQADLKTVIADANKTPIKPVDYAHTLALLESRLMAVQNVSRGKILATRMPDLSIQLNALQSFKGWEVRNLPEKKEGAK